MSYPPPPNNNLESQSPQQPPPMMMPPLAPLYKQRSWSPDIYRDEAWLRRKENNKKGRRSKSVTDEDLDELKACIELGFGFEFDSPELDQRLSHTLPALGLYYAVNKSYNGVTSSSVSSLSGASDCDSIPSPIGSPHTIFGPGDPPQTVKTRLKQWAQVVACSVRQSSRATAAIGYLFLLLFSFFITISAACFNGNCQVLDSCSQATDCGPGLYCGNCPALGKSQPFCTRGQAIIPTSIIGGLPLNKYSWLMTHNSFSIVDAPSLQGVQRLTFYNQEDTVTNQLMNGVRGLMLDMYDFNGDIWLCHSFRGQCFNFTAFQPAINTLREVEAFLSQNPSEIVTIIIEDYVHTPKGLSNLFTSAGLDKYWFPVSKMPRKGEDWPTVNEMVQANHRLLVFTSVASKEAEEGIAYQWKYILENEAGDPGVKPGSCPNRKESRPLNSKSASLFLMNYFPTYPVENEACKEHSAPLADMIGTCFKAAGSMLPNFIAVNFYMRSDGGGVFYDLDSMNGQRLCGCKTIAACQAGAPFGSCKNISMPSKSPMTNTAGSFSGSVQFSKSASAVYHPNRFIVGFFSIPWMFLLLL